MGVQLRAIIQYSTLATSLLHDLDDEVDVGFSQETGGDTRVFVITKITITAVQVHTNKGVPGVSMNLDFLKQSKYDKCYLAYPRLSISFMNNGLPMSIK